VHFVLELTVAIGERSAFGAFATMAMGAQPQEINFGSLRAFLGVGDSKPSSLGQLLQPSSKHVKRPERSSNAGGPSIGLPSMRPEHDPFQDSANLNKKVAFKMLKQLGCPVQTVESEDDNGNGGSSVHCFIEVRKNVQPVLFQMLIEFGYQPFLTVDRAVAIRVDQPRYRARDDVFAALATRKPSQNLTEDLPKPMRPKMSAEDEQRMIERLAERKAKKNAEADELPPEKDVRKYKSMAEQRAAVDRLTRARNEKEAAAPSQSNASAHESSVSRSETWPRPGARLRGVSADAAYRPRSSVEDSRLAKSNPVRRSPCLSQVGALMLQSSASASDHGGGETRPVLLNGELASSTSLPEAAFCKESEGSNAENVACDAVASSRDRNEPEPHSRAWIDNVLGPLQWPGKASSSMRSKAEQQQHLERLAKPRPPPLPQPAEQPTSVAKRSPRAQKEACDRLAKPREITHSNQSPSACTSDAEMDAPIGTEGRQSRQSVGSEESEETEEPRVVIIPSMLSEFSQGLERIDEDAPPPSVSSKSGCRESRLRQRASSVPPPSSSATPYSIPVVPNSKNSTVEKSKNGSNRRCRRDSRRRNVNEVIDARSEIPESSLEQLLNDPDLIAEVVQEEIDENGVEGGEAMLAHIDRLYNSLMQRREPDATLLSEPEKLPEPSSTTYYHRSAESEALHSAPQVLDECNTSSHSALSHFAQGDSLDPEAGNGTACQQQQSYPADCEEEDTSLLANIDQLYNEIVNSDLRAEDIERAYSTSSTPCVEEERLVALEEQSMGPHADGEEVKDLLSMLEEVLWSALLLKRNAAAGIDVQASLLELVSPPDFARCFKLCGSQSLTSSLLHRLAAELPAVHTGLHCTSPFPGGSCSKSLSTLASCLRQARDHLLVLASTSSTSSVASSDAALQSDSGASTVKDRISKKTKARKSSLSYWTPDSLTAMEAPPRRLTQRLPR